MQYNDLKTQLASQHPDDRMAYTSGKAEFIKAAIASAKQRYQAI